MTRNRILLISFLTLAAPASQAADDNVTVPREAIETIQSQLQATEQTAAEQMKGQRDWRAKAIQLDNMVTALKLQVTEAKKTCTAPASEPPKQ